MQKLKDEANSAAAVAVESAAIIANLELAETQGERAPAAAAAQATHAPTSSTSGINDSKSSSSSADTYSGGNNANSDVVERQEQSANAPLPTEASSQTTTIPAAAAVAGAGAAVATAATASSNERQTKRGGKAIIIVPYRDLHPEQQRAQHLQRFLTELPRLLTAHIKGERGGEERNEEGVKERRERVVTGGTGGGGASILPSYHIYIIEQSNDDRKFNRGKLLNIGFDIALKDSKKAAEKKGREEEKEEEEDGTREGEREDAVGASVFIFHDVDLLPRPSLIPLYLTRPSLPVHIARAWKRYSGNPKYFGGAVAFNSKDFIRINGFPNTFWGWGGEDDEMRKRVDEVGLEVGKTTKEEEEGGMEDMEG
eukprot:evm.model.NODE_11899_length_10434_cov_23.175005.5